MSVHYVAIPTDGGRYLAHFGRAQNIAVFAIDEGRVISREDRLNPDPEHLNPAHHRVMLHLVHGCHVVVASHIGAPMIKSLRGQGIDVLGAPTESVEGAVQAYLRSRRGGVALESLAT